MDIIPTLMFFTLGAAALVAIGLFAYFLRRRKNREAAKDALLD
jgi:LPXTG-motif cell wall-anchored protein